MQEIGLLFLVLAYALVCAWGEPPKHMDNDHRDAAYGSGSCSGALSCGSTMATVNGIAAKSNGADQCTGNCCGGEVSTGCAYQCVELAQRYYNHFWGTPDHWGVSYAYQMCDIYPPPVKKYSPSSYIPKMGDLIVFNWAPDGHVAVVTSATASTVNVVEQNNAVSGKNSYPTSEAYCFLSANFTGPSCSSSMVGWYCGNDGVNGITNYRYYCDNGQVTNSQKCDVCEIVPGSNDVCSTATCTSNMVGWYCGTDRVNGGDANGLYYCENSVATTATHCTNGCVTAPSGESDYCKS